MQNSAVNKSCIEILVYFCILKFVGIKCVLEATVQYIISDFQTCNAKQ